MNTPARPPAVPLSAQDRARLEVHRARLERALDAPDTSPRDLAALGREYRQTITQLGAVAAVAEDGSLVDELRSRRNRKGA